MENFCLLVGVIHWICLILSNMCNICHNFVHIQIAINLYWPYFALFWWHMCMAQLAECYISVPIPLLLSCNPASSPVVPGDLRSWTWRVDEMYIFYYIMYNITFTEMAVHQVMYEYWCINKEDLLWFDGKSWHKRCTVGTEQKWMEHVYFLLE
jgi:hypothetical protein